jgi:hypothetical protein
MKSELSSELSSKLGSELSSKLGSELSSKLDSKLGSMKSELSSELRSVKSEISSNLSSVMSKLSSVMSNLSSVMSEVASVKSEVASVKSEVASVKSEVNSVKTTLNQLALAVVTPEAAAKIELCADSTALLLEIPTARLPDDHLHCSTVPMFAPAASDTATYSGTARATNSTFFLTSAHCFSLGIAAEQLIRVFFKRAPYPCRLFHLFNNSGAPLDLALVHCAEGVPVPPTALTEQPYFLQMPAALLGFSKGEHVDASRTLYANGTGNIALHIRFARLALSLQLPREPQAAATLVLYAHGAAQQRIILPGSTGYVDISPERGMSGGAVVDLQCGLRGISETKSVFGVGSLLCS